MEHNRNEAVSFCFFVSFFPFLLRLNIKTQFLLILKGDKTNKQTKLKERQTFPDVFVLTGTE